MTDVKLQLAEVVATPGAMETAERYAVSLAGLLRRHATGDWGDVDAHDKRTNDQALARGDRVISSYGEGEARLWVITDAGHRVTTILQPGEY